ERTLWIARIGSRRWITSLSNRRGGVVEQVANDKLVVHEPIAAGGEGAIRIAGCGCRRGAARVVDAVAVFACRLVPATVAAAHGTALGIAGRAVGLRATLGAGCSRSRITLFARERRRCREEVHDEGRVQLALP